MRLFHNTEIHILYKPAELLYTLPNSQASLGLAHSLHNSLNQSVASAASILGDTYISLGASCRLTFRAALLLYKWYNRLPKGVMPTHAAVSVQTELLVNACH